MADAIILSSCGMPPLKCVIRGYPLIYHYIIRAAGGF